MRAETWQHGVQDDWEHGAVAEWLRWAGPALLVLLLLVLIAKALRRHRRYRTAGTLTQDDLDAIHEALRAAERRTVGEIVPVVLESSDPHPAARWRAVVAAMLLGTALLAPWLPWHEPPWLLALQVGLGAGAALLLAALPDLQRTFVSESHATELSEEQAQHMFFRLALHETARRTGVLIFVSLFERRVVVLADRGIDAVVDRTTWSLARDAVLTGIARGNLRQGLIDGIEQVGRVLAEHFPWEEGDRNELPDRLIVQSRAER